MSERCVWVIETKNYPSSMGMSEQWLADPALSFESRERAQLYIDKVKHKRCSYKIVKYVPAETK